MKTTLITPDILIQKRNYIISEIKKNWKVIAENNIIPKGWKQKFDLEKVYASIKTAESELVQIKLASQAANFGFKSIDEIPKDNIVTTILTLSQVSERIVKLNLIPTKKDEGETTVFTRSFIDSEISKLGKEKGALEAKLEDFNSKKLFNF